MFEISFTVQKNRAGDRVDIFLARRLTRDFSRSQIKKAIQAGTILVNGETVKPNYELEAGDKIDVKIEPETGPDLKAQDIPLDVVYEDEDVIVVNKPVGMVVHPACGNPDNTLVNALLFHTKKNLSDAGGEIRSGIVHRLDKDTSGLIIAAKNNKAHTNLTKQFSKRTIDRKYYAVVSGVVQHDEGVCEKPLGKSDSNRKKVVVKEEDLGGKSAVTNYRVLERFRKATLLEVKLGTGRTHQIRVHMQHIGHPILGDLTYGKNSPYIDRPALHAKTLAFTHPKTGERIELNSDLPNDMKRLIEHLKSD